MGNFAGGMIGYLIVTGFSVVLLWSLLKVAASFSTFTEKAAKGVFSFAEKLVSTVPIVPLPTGMASFAGLKQTKDDFSR